MAFVNLVPKLYSSIIEDVIEGVKDLFAEEGVEEQVLKDLKKLWETKVSQSKATEDFSRSNVPAPLFTVKSPHSLPPTLPSTASLVIPAGRSLPGFTSEELSTFNSSTSFAFPGYPIHVPAGLTVQAPFGHLYKVNVPAMVTQASGRAGGVQHPFQQVFEQLGQPSLMEASVPPKLPRTEAVLQQPSVLLGALADSKPFENTLSHRHVHPGHEPPIMSQPETSPYISIPAVGFPAQVSQTDPNLETVLGGVPASLTPNQLGGPFSHQGTLYHHLPDLQAQALKSMMHGYGGAQQPRAAEEPNSPPNSNSEMDLNIQVVDDDINEIIQVDGPGDTSSSEEVGSIRDGDENEFPGTVEEGDLKVLKEDADSVSNGSSTANNSDAEDHQIDVVEEDPLNSEDDVSEQDVPDLFDTENVIVCQYDKIHRSKSRWKFYLKDGIMCFGGRDYVFSRAIGDAEW
uniref:General transcription factor IIA, 1-like n=1 Tax=Jaculus jaculus TaxID=51337 RepID=A0A8C5KXR9_JACJA